MKHASWSICQTNADARPTSIQLTFVHAPGFGLLSVRAEVLAPAVLTVLFLCGAGLSLAYMQRVANQWRSFRIAAWLGWQVESNCTTPWASARYSMVNPLAMAGILVAMYAAATPGDFHAPVFTTSILATVSTLYLGAVMTGMAYAVVTYWLELIRCALVGRAAGEFQTFARLTDLQVLGVLAIQTLVLGAVALSTFRRCDTAARKRGLIDRTTNY